MFMAPNLTTGAPLIADDQEQEPLVAFLKAFLELLFTLLETARIAAGRSQSALEAVRQSLLVICSLEGRVEDSRSRLAIHNRTIDLELALDACSMLLA
jgi:hypothetical protein